MADKAVVTQSTLDAIGQAIISKGGATAPMTPAQMPAAIQSIPSYGKYWTKPDDWPDIKAILNADDPTDYGLPATYTHKMIVLFGFADGDIGKVELKGAKSYRTDVGNVITLETSYVELGSGYHWVICYSDVDMTSLPAVQGARSDGTLGGDLWYFGVNCKVNIQSHTQSLYQRSFYSFEGIDIHISGNGNIGGESRVVILDSVIDAPDFSGPYILSGCYSLKYIKSLSGMRITNGSGSFRDCASLLEVPTIDTSEMTSAAGMFQNCYCLEKVPTLDFGSCTNTSSMFSMCVNLKNLNSVFNLPLATNLSNMFNGCTSLTDQIESINAPLATTTTRIFDGCKSLVKLPTTLNFPLSKFSVNGEFYRCYSMQILPVNLTVADGSVVDFSASRFIKGDSIATFDANGTITGGLCKTITPAETSSEIRFASAVRTSNFTTEQVTAIEAAFDELNWTVSW